MEKREEAQNRLQDLLRLQAAMAEEFDENQYNVFIFGSYLTTAYVEGKSDIDIAIYTEDFGLYKRLSYYLEEYFGAKNIPGDIFYIDLSMVAPIYCAPLKSKVQFTDYFPEQLKEFEKQCQERLRELKEKMDV